MVREPQGLDLSNIFKAFTTKYQEELREKRRQKKYIGYIYSDGFTINARRDDRAEGGYIDAPAQGTLQQRGKHLVINVFMKYYNFFSSFLGPAIIIIVFIGLSIAVLYSENYEQVWPYIIFINLGLLLMLISMGVSRVRNIKKTRKDLEELFHSFTQQT